MNSEKWTKDPLELKLSALRIGSSAVWIPTATLLKILNDLLADSCIASRAGKEKNNEIVQCK